MGFDKFIVDEYDLMADTFATTTQAVGVPDREDAVAHAAFIVTACNNQAALVKALSDE